MGPPPRKAGWTEDERQLRSEAIASAFAAEKIDAVVFGAQDWRLGKERLDELAGRYTLPVLAANLRCDGVAPYRAYTQVQRGGLTVGIIGLTQGVVPDNCILIDPAEAVRAVQESWDSVDIAIAAVAATRPSDVSPDLGVDLVLHAQGRSEGSLLPLKQGWQMSCGRRGRSLQHVKLTWREGALGWHADVKLELAASVQKITSRIDRLQERRARTTSEVAQERLGGQIATLRTEQSKLREHLAKVIDDGSRHLLTSVNVDLSDKISDHPEAAKQLVDWNARLNEIKGATTRRETSREGPGN